MLKNIVILICAIIFCACNSSTSDNYPLYQVKKQDFENTIIVSGSVEPVNTALATCPNDISGEISYIIDDGIYVEEGDTLCIIKNQSFITEIEEIRSHLENAEARLERTKADLDLQYSLLEAQVKNNEAEASIAFLDSVSLKFATPKQKRINELNMRKAAIEKLKLEKKLKALAVINQTEKKRITLEIERLKSILPRMQEYIDALIIKAPKKGLAIVARNQKWGEKLRIGDNVWDLNPIVSIPDMDTMKVKLKVTEADFKLINIDDSIAYTFDAMPGNEGWGKIRLKTPIGRQHKEGSKVKFFDIEASMDSVITVPEPGFTANCKIILSQAKDTLVVPQVAVYEQDSMKVVFVKKNKNFEMRQVETGIYSQKEIIVTNGLSEGEEISLIKPNTKDIKNTVKLPIKQDINIIQEDEYEEESN
ncbi:HlyD family secretion protein [Dysgonomonadaceae bacterium PH5-43]|nr:HlyD family secretion protein [Dysgonomonadaceae bacterium PH5-43]